MKREDKRRTWGVKEHCFRQQWVTCQTLQGFIDIWVQHLQTTHSVYKMCRPAKAELCIFCFMARVNWQCYYTSVSHNRNIYKDYSLLVYYDRWVVLFYVLHRDFGWAGTMGHKYIPAYPRKVSLCKVYLLSVKPFSTLHSNMTVPRGQKECWEGRRLDSIFCFFDCIPQM